MNRIAARASCNHCGAAHVVDRDEDGYTDLDCVPCQGSDTCTAHLCVACRRQCFSCGLWVCEDHSTVIDGRPWCDVCTAAALDGLEPAPAGVGHAA